MAILVIHLFEVIQIDHEQADSRLVRGRRAAFQITNITRDTCILDHHELLEEAPVVEVG